MWASARSAEKSGSGALAGAAAGGEGRAAKPTPTATATATAMTTASAVSRHSRLTILCIIVFLLSRRLPLRAPPGGCCESPARPGGRPQSAPRGADFGLFVHVLPVQVPAGEQHAPVPRNVHVRPVSEIAAQPARVDERVGGRDPAVDGDAAARRRVRQRAVHRPLCEDDELGRPP